VKTPKPKFNDWLQQSFLLLGRQPKFWLCYGLLVGVMLVVGRVSPIIGIFSTVLFLFAGVGLAKYSDLKTTSDSPVGFYWAIKQTLPLAVLAASAVVLTPEGAFMGAAVVALTVAAAEFRLVLLYIDIMIFNPVKT
jgi:hypothetical protein